jgi:quercetin dioxygenase-like cupin family protein
MGVARDAAFCYCGIFIVEYRPMEHAMPNSKEIEAKSHNPVPQSYVLGAGEGEHLIHFRDGGNIFIKVDPVKGSNNLALGTQQLPKGSGIPVHRHPHNDEAFYVLEGSGSVTLNIYGGEKHEPRDWALESGRLSGQSGLRGRSGGKRPVAFDGQRSLVPRLSPGRGGSILLPDRCAIRPFAPFMSNPMAQNSMS